MHRRAALNLSRSHGAGWPSLAARNRDAAFAPVIVSSVLRRTFRSSLVSLDSSDGPDSNSTTPKPKFGGRWGSSSSQKPATLSPAEQAIRDALIARKSAAREQEAQSTASPKSPASASTDLFEQLQSTSAPPGDVNSSKWGGKRFSPRFSTEKSTSESLKTSHGYPEKTTQNRDRRRQTWKCPSCGFNSLPNFTTCKRCGAHASAEVIAENAEAFRQQKQQQQQRRQQQQQPGGQHRHQQQHQHHGQHQPRQNRWGQHPSLQPDRKLEGQPRTPHHVRQKDWTCPDCQYHCFGRHIVCPQCKAARPDQSLRIRKLGSQHPSGTSGDTGALDNRQKALLKHAFYQEHGSDEEPVVTGIGTGQPDIPSAATGAFGDMEEPRSHRKFKETKKPETEQKSWSWDASLFETQDKNAPQEKSSKRRENRRQQADDEFDAEERRQQRLERKRSKKEKSRHKELDTTPSPLYLPEFISVGDLANVIGVRPAQFVARMEDMGFEEVSYSHVLDAETAGLVAIEFNFEPIFDTGGEELTPADEPEDKSMLPSRPPVVTIMGHVDHGKTTILDWLRNSSVAASEHGGITQHIGAFSVAMPSGKTITFLDTPGHAAFLDMRRRGADVTDIVVLVVAADDSVKPQTIEAIKHATGSQVPIIVAMSKIDKPDSNPERVKQDLSSHGVHVEDFGGDVQAIGVSGKTGQGMLELEEAIVTLSEVLDYRADPQGNVEGWVIEATTKSYGRVATVLVRRGTLRTGDIIVAGTAWARVRTLRNEAGVAIDEATPGTPVEIDGWREQPEAGAEVLQAPNEQKARAVVEYRMERLETQKLGEDTAAINEARRQVVEKRRKEKFDKGEADSDPTPSGPKPVNYIIKADVGGSAEAVLNSVAAIGNNEVFANVIRSGVGPVTEFDIEHAEASHGHVVSFNMPIEPAILRMAEARGVKIMNHNIIYKLIDDIRETLSEQLPPLVTQRVTGEAEIGQVFDISMKGRGKVSIAGCRVRNGLINRTRKVRVLRGNETIYDGAISSLKNVKKDVTEMRKDTECGIGFEEWTEFAVGDRVQCYEEVFEKRYL
ncbi:initiation factor 2 [Aspergillus taichungensis]|uniref:Translation initiation factor IF-2, mitochondrial n=1 Tax=Aspergillus taichungensis TaxID=482145 RepID=A0A2J5HVF7_9EURO|nr:initiation factor 2 [Aspergillus taichungensis]